MDIHGNDILNYMTPKNIKNKSKLNCTKLYVLWLWIKIYGLMNVYTYTLNLMYFVNTFILKCLNVMKGKYMIVL